MGYAEYISYDNLITVIHKADLIQLLPCSLTIQTRQDVIMYIVIEMSTPKTLQCNESTKYTREYGESIEG